MTKKVLTNELLIGISAMIISLSSLVVFIYQTKLIKKQQYKSVYPHLNFVHMHSNSIDYHFVIRNQGIGPAFITAIEIEDAEGTTFDNILDYLEHAIDKKDSISINYTDIQVGSLIQEKQNIELVKLSDKAVNTKTFAKANILRQKLLSNLLRLTIEYESIYEEKWSINNNSNIPQKH